MKNTSEPVSRQVIPTEDGYKVITDHGRLGTSTVIVHVPRGNPEAAAKTRRDINAVLAPYGYRLADRTGAQAEDGGGTAP